MPGALATNIDRLSAVSIFRSDGAWNLGRWVTTPAVRWGALITCSLLLSGCLVPSEPAKQAEEISSISAEGALLAHGVAEDGVTDIFMQVHAEALRKQLSQLEPKVQVDAVSNVLRDADAALALLQDGPAAPGLLEQRLERISKRAEELAK